MFCTQAGPGCSTIAELGMAQAAAHVLGTRTVPGALRAPWAAKPPRGESPGPPQRDLHKPEAAPGRFTFKHQLCPAHGLEEQEEGKTRKWPERLPQLPAPARRARATKKRIKTNRNISCCQPAVVTPSPRGRCCSSPSLAVLLKYLRERLEWSQGRRRGFATKMPLPVRNEAQCTHIQNECLLFVSPAL